MGTEQTSLPVLGRSLHVQARTPGLITWLERQWSFPEHRLSSVGYSIFLEETDAPRALPDGTPVRVRLQRMSLTALAAEGSWWFGDAEAGVELRPGDVESRIAVWGLVREDGPAAMYAALFVALAESLRASGLLSLHAAVAVRNGKATALAGASGVGKSTTLWRLVRAGWVPLAEDFAWLDPTSAIVYGWDRGLRLWPEARERFAPELRNRDLCSDPDGKLFLAYERLSGPIVRVATLERLAVLERAVEGIAVGTSTPLLATTRVPVPLAAHEAVRAWWETTGVPLAPSVRERVAAAIATLVRRVDAVRLTLGSGRGPLPL